jgi:PTH2 family peptidyl-tRNA hydrolase
MSELEQLKQVIVMRNDLNMRKGKMVAQGAHASMWFLFMRAIHGQDLTEEAAAWMQFGMTKICVRCDSEAELSDIETRAKESGLTVHVITDAGHTEFSGVPTKTCLAIGPNAISEIDKITGALKLL